MTLKTHEAIGKVPEGTAADAVNSGDSERHGNHRE